MTSLDSHMPTRQLPSKVRVLGFRVMAHRLVGAAEIGMLLGGLSRQRVYQLTTRDDFPEPVAVLASGKIWNYTDITAYARRTGRTIHALPDDT
jgi:prophage regulatory protein